MQIKDKIALVTGGASGLGFEYITELLQNGAKHVVMLDLNKSVGEAAIAKLESQFGKKRVIFFACDVTKAEQLEESFKKTIRAFNGLDIVINNAGILNDDRWELEININFMALVRSSLLAVTYMGKHKGGKGGTVVNVSSLYGLTIDKYVPVYQGTKYAVRAFTQSISMHYEKTGVRFLTMCPGCTSTYMISQLSNHFLDFIDREEAAKYFLEHPCTQSPKHVALAMVDLIQKGENGAVWCSENNEPPTAIGNFPDYRTLIVST